jgi:GT2 family glycosyltransferase
MYSIFIITRNRSNILKSTIEEIFKQTFPPDSLLIIDNSDDEDTQLMYEQTNDSRLQYHKVGYNSGPAGAAAIGIKILFEQGYDWVVWGDDDDPPKFNDVMESLFSIIPKIDIKTIGVIGSVGVNFNIKTGLIERIPDKDLDGLLDVDCVAGNMFPLLHRNIYLNTIFPDPDLFFGFEELDFCLAVKRAKLRIIVPAKEMYRHRVIHKRLNLEKSYKLKALQSLWREYYGVRNRIYILLKKEKSCVGVFRISIRTIAKIFYGFKFGYEYGRLNFYFLSKGLYDGFRNRMGMTITPIPKK